jgi:hypothetical protein
MSTLATVKSIIQRAAVGASRDPQQHTLTLTPPQKGKKMYSGSTFIETKCMIYSVKGDTRISHILAGRREPLDLHINGCASVFGSDKGDKKQNNSTKASLKLPLASLPADEKRCMELLESEFLREVGRPEILSLWRNPQMNTPTISCHIKRVYTAKCPDPEKIGKQRATPIVDFKIRFDNFPENFGQLSNQPRSTVYDWTTRRTNAKGKEEFDQCVDKNGKTINADNCGELLNSEHTIRRVEFRIDGASYNTDGFSFGLSIYKIYVERTGQFDNIIEADDEIAVAPAPAPAPAQTFTKKSIVNTKPRIADEIEGTVVDDDDDNDEDDDNEEILA